MLLQAAAHGLRGRLRVRRPGPHDEPLGAGRVRASPAHHCWLAPVRGRQAASAVVPHVRARARNPCPTNWTRVCRCPRARARASSRRAGCDGRAAPAREPQGTHAVGIRVARSRRAQAGGKASVGVARYRGRRLHSARAGADNVSAGYAPLPARLPVAPHRQAARPPTGRQLRLARRGCLLRFYTV